LSNAQDLGPGVQLSWSGGDPDETDTVTYDLLLGIDELNLDKVAEGLTHPGFVLENVKENTTYYWKVISCDGKAYTAGDVWRFTTGSFTSSNRAPYVPGNPVPASGSADRGLSLSLSWEGGDPDSGDVVIYTVLFGTDPDSLKTVSVQQERTSFAVAGLDYGRTYFWKVIASDNIEFVHSGLWSFSTMSSPVVNNPPFLPSDPQPVDYAENMDTDVFLSWKGGDPDSGDQLTYDVYLDNANPPTIRIASSLDGTVLQTVGLQEGAVYYWRVVVHDGDTLRTGPVWRFSTKVHPRLTITSPDGGEIWEAGKQQDITWTWSGAIDSVKLHCFMAGSWVTIVEATANDGLYSWEVMGGFTGMARLRVSSLSGSVWDESNGLFEIIPGLAPLTPVLTLPGEGSADNALLDIDFTLPEPALEGSVKMVFIQTGGSPDIHSPHTVIFSSAFSATGRHTAVLNGADLSSHPAVASVSSSPSDFLADGSIYAVRLEYLDSLSRPSNAAVHQNFRYDITAPAVVLTSPASGDTLTDTQALSYALSETAVQGTVTWTWSGGTPDPGSPHVQALTAAELDSGLHADITLVNNPGLVMGAQYNVSISVTDAAGNSSNAVVAANVVYHSADDYSQWYYRGKVTFNTTATGANILGDVTDFPMLLRLDAGNFYFHQAMPHGEDIRFSKSDGTPLPYEIERWDNLLQVAEIWVRLDTVYGNNDTQSFYIYWGNVAAADSSDGEAVFSTDKGFKGVWHLNDGPQDATADHNHASLSGGSGPSSVSGIIGGCMDFDGVDDFLRVANAPSLEMGDNFTFSLWVKWESGAIPDRSARLLDKKEHNAAANGWTVHLDINDDDEIRVAGSSAQITSIPYFVDSWAAGGWHYVVLIFDGDMVYSYADGLPAGNGTISSVMDNDMDLFIGRSGGGNDFWHGKMDEIRISKGIRSSDWIKLSYLSQDY
jgi:hypothetical protein